MMASIERAIVPATNGVNGVLLLVDVSTWLAESKVSPFPASVYNYSWR